MAVHFARLLVVLSILGIAGCVSTPGREYQITNEKLERDYAPIRLVTKPLGKDSTITTAEWAGTGGESITSRSPQVRADVFRALKERCGFEQEKLFETRLVSHKAPLPNGGGVDFKLSGECHSKEAPVFISTR